RRLDGNTRSWCGGSPRWRFGTLREPRPRVSCSLRPVARAQRARFEALAAATGVFRPAEAAIAVEVLDEALAGDDDYRFVGAYEGGADTLVGFVCWGPTPATAGTWDLYWIAVGPRWQPSSGRSTSPRSNGCGRPPRTSSSGSRRRWST